MDFNKPTQYAKPGMLTPAAETPPPISSKRRALFGYLVAIAQLALIIALVAHYRIDSPALTEMRRVLAPEGKPPLAQAGASVVCILAGAAGMIHGPSNELVTKLEGEALIAGLSTPASQESAIETARSTFSTLRNWLVAREGLLLR